MHAIEAGDTVHSRDIPHRMQAIVARSSNDPKVLQRYRDLVKNLEKKARHPGKPRVAMKHAKGNVIGGDSVCTLIVSLIHAKDTKDAKNETQRLPPFVATDAQGTSDVVFFDPTW